MIDSSEVSESAARVWKVAVRKPEVRRDIRQLCDTANITDCELPRIISELYRSGWIRGTALPLVPVSLAEQPRLRRDRLKTKARKRLSDAVQSGRVSKPSVCSECNREYDRKEIHGHHHDYSMELEVTWLCARCHRATHGANA